MQKRFLFTAAIMGAIAVALGAFGAHALKSLATEKSIQVYETAIKYQFFHALALLATGILYKDFSNKYTKIAGLCFIIGVVLFSGSLYLLTIKDIVNQDWLKWFGPVTPVGGLLLVCGWLFLAIGFTKKADKLSTIHR